MLCWSKTQYKKKLLPRFQGKNIVITGGSSGIGLAIAKEFVLLEANVHLIARRLELLRSAQQELSSLANSKQSIEVYAVDVRNEQHISEIIQQIYCSFGGIHTVINNAGVTKDGFFQDLSLRELEWVMQVNYFGSIHVLKAAWPYLKQANHGQIVFVSSVAGYLGLMGYSSYAPSKFALGGIAECIRMEAKDYGIATTIIYPPDTDTPMYQEEQKSTLPECKALSKHAALVSPSSVAKKLMWGIARGRFEVFCNIESRFIRLLRFLWPSLLFYCVDFIVRQDRKQRKK